MRLLFQLAVWQPKVWGPMAPGEACPQPVPGTGRRSVVSLGHPLSCSATWGGGNILDLSSRPRITTKTTRETAARAGISLLGFPKTCRVSQTLCPNTASQAARAGSSSDIAVKLSGLPRSRLQPGPNAHQGRVPDNPGSLTGGLEPAAPLVLPVPAKPS